MSSCNLLRDLLDLKDVYQLYKDGEPIEEDLAEEILSRNRRSLPSFNTEEIAPDVTELNTLLTEGIILLLRHVGYAEWEDTAVDVLSNVVVDRLRSMIGEYNLSNQRRKSGLATAFATPIQHSLCLHGIFNFIVLKQHYDLNYGKPFRKLETTVRKLFGQDNAKREEIKVNRKRKSEPPQKKNSKKARRSKV